MGSSRRSSSGDDEVIGARSTTIQQVAHRMGGVDPELDGTLGYPIQPSGPTQGPTPEITCLLSDELTVVGVGPGHRCCDQTDSGDVYW